MNDEADIVHNECLEKAIVKIQNGLPEASLTVAEKTLAARFAVQESQTSEAPMDFAHRLENEMKRRRTSMKRRYMNIYWIPTTSNIVERLFSRARLNLTHLRARLEPKTLEALLCLHCNRGLWDQNLISGLCALEVHNGTDGEDNTL